MAQTKTKNIFQKMNGVMSDLDGSIEKDGQVTYGNKYKYVSISGLTNQVRRSLVANGLAFYTDLVVEDRSGKGLVQTYKCSLVNSDDPSEKIEMHMVGSSNDQSPTSSGICLSYAVKNCFLKMFCLAGDDEDAEAHAGSPSSKGSQGGGAPKKTGPKAKPAPKPVRCTVLSVNDVFSYSEVIVKKTEDGKELKTMTSVSEVVEMARAICDAKAEAIIETRLTDKGNLELVSIKEVS